MKIGDRHSLQFRTHQNMAAQNTLLDVWENKIWQNLNALFVKYTCKKSQPVAQMKSLKTINYFFHLSSDVKNMCKTVIQVSAYKFNHLIAFYSDQK